MKFNSVREYFYKMYTMLYAFLLGPLLLFAYLYMQIRAENIEPMFARDATVIVATLTTLTVVEWAVAMWLFRRSLKPLLSLATVAEKLSRYNSATRVRFGILCLGALPLAVGFYLTGDNTLPGVFGVSLFLLSLFWPLPRKVCSDLKLKGEERKMVLYRLDSL